MAKQTFTTGQVLTAAQMTSLQQTAMGGGSATTKTTSYVLVAADAGTTVTMTSASATTITVNTSLFAAGDTVYIQNLGAGVCTITAGTATVNTSASLALAQYEGGQLYFNSTSAAIFVKGAGGSSGGMTLLSTTTLSGTSTTVSSISQSYKNLFVEVFGATWDTGNSNGAFATNHTSAISYKKVQTTDFGSAYLQTTCSDLDNNVDSWLNSGGNNYLNFTFFNYASTTTFKNFNITGSYNGTTNNGRVIQLFGGIASNTAMTDFTFKNTASYTLTAGTIRVYGVN